MIIHLLFVANCLNSVQVQLAAHAGDMVIVIEFKNLGEVVKPKPDNEYDEHAVHIFVIIYK
jgi:hypothetical protein